jgi:hypothetical protein
MRFLTLISGLVYNAVFDGHLGTGYFLQGDGLGTLSCNKNTKCLKEMFIENITNRNHSNSKIHKINIGFGGVPRRVIRDSGC